MPATNRRRRGLALLVGGLLACAPPAAAQVTARVWVEVEPPRPTAGDLFRLNIHVSGLRLDSIRVLEPTPPVYLEFVSGPDLLPAVVDGVAQGDVVPDRRLVEAGTPAAAAQQRVVSYSLRARRPGRYLVDGFLIRLASGSLYTRETPIQVVTPPRTDAAKPTVAWVLPQRRAVVGQAISVHLVLVQWDTLQLPERIEVRPPADSWFEQYAGEAGIGEQVSAAGRAYHIPLASYLLTPTRTGSIAVPPARVSLETTTGPVVLFSEAVTVTVSEPPPEIAGSGAVGTLHATARIVERPHQHGLEIIVQVAVEGTGNHRFIKLPEPAAGSLNLADRTVRDDLVLRDAGYTGQVAATYRYLVTHPGRYPIQVPEFVSYDPLAGHVRRAAGLNQVVELQVATPTAGAEAVPLRPAPLARVSRQRCWQPWLIARSYLLLLAVPLVGAAWWWSRRRGRLPLVAGCLAAAAVTGLALWPLSRSTPDVLLAAALEDADRAYEERDYAVAQAGYETAWRQLGCSPPLSYNLAVSALGRGATSAAIGWLREAIRGAPLDRRYRTLLGDVERRAGLVTQHRPPPFLPPAIPFHAVLLLGGALLTVGCYHAIPRHAMDRRAARATDRGRAGGQPRGSQGRVGSRRSAPLSVAVVAASVVALALLAAAGIDQRRHIVVVGSTELRRIPRADASPWIPLDAGVTLEVRGAHRDHLLVRTAYGLDAWVNTAAVVGAGSARGG